MRGHLYHSDNRVYGADCFHGSRNASPGLTPMLFRRAERMGLSLDVETVEVDW